MIDSAAIYTPDEAADLLRLTRRAVITAGKRYGLCFVRGREVRFTGQHLVDLIEAMRFKPISPIQQRYSSAFQSVKSGERLHAYFAEQRAKKDARKAANATAKREESLRRQREKAEARRQAKEAIAAARKAQHATPTVPVHEQLDYQNRDPAYWTPERKERLRLERVERMKQWTQDHDN